MTRGLAFFCEKRKSKFKSFKLFILLIQIIKTQNLKQISQIGLNRSFSLQHLFHVCELAKERENPENKLYFMEDFGSYVCTFNCLILNKGFMIMPQFCNVTISLI